MTGLDVLSVGAWALFDYIPAAPITTPRKAKRLN